MKDIELTCANCHRNLNVYTVYSQGGKTYITIRPCDNCLQQAEADARRSVIDRR